MNIADTLGKNFLWKTLKIGFNNFLDFSAIYENSWVFEVFREPRDWNFRVYLKISYSFRNGLLLKCTKIPDFFNSFYLCIFTWFSEEPKLIANFKNKYSKDGRENKRFSAQFFGIPLVFEKIRVFHRTRVGVNILNNQM